MCAVCCDVTVHQDGVIMAGSGVEIGKNVLIIYNDSPSPLNVTSLGVSSVAASPSDWIIPGYYYPPRAFVCYALLTTSDGQISNQISL